MTDDWMPLPWLESRSKDRVFEDDGLCNTHMTAVACYEEWNSSGLKDDK